MSVATATVATTVATTAAVVTSTPSTTLPWVFPGDQVERLNQTVNAAVYIGAMAWGLNTAVFCKAVYTLLRNGAHRWWLWLSLISALWVLSTVNIGCDIGSNTLVFIEYSHTQAFYHTTMQSTPVVVTSVITAIASLILTDAFLIFRCEMIWRCLYTSVPLGLFYVVSVACAITQCVVIARSNGSIWTGALLNGPFLVYIIIAGCLHVVITMLIFGRLMHYRWHMPNTVMLEFVKETMGVTSIIVESAIPYAVVSFVWMILSCIQNVGANVFVPLLVQIQGITAGMIITRMADYSAWSSSYLQSIVEKAQVSDDAFLPAKV
ncbi:hypothetical protein WOLCODRAFT_139126 [Wolfiporia cocos MD-104 SS10]|uniref:Uncharacterized protein n=1 Tax=Wolfiporia cocos (strain MD-104) TaxID=742152 RepID=A0A2H3JR84_WOLCO|nr:hypothetical protein WOLCODRAFT_139126 [Wolfiporia cocos MD-104 SS10]